MAISGCIQHGKELCTKYVLALLFVDIESGNVAIQLSSALWHTQTLPSVCLNANSNYKSANHRCVFQVADIFPTVRVPFQLRHRTSTSEKDCVRFQVLFYYVFSFLPIEISYVTGLSADILYVCCS